MKISTRGRYAVRVMLDIAENHGSHVPMKDVAARQQLSLKYVESILPALVRAGLVCGVSGKGGGYTLSRPPEEITLRDVLLAAEGDLAPVACLSCGAKPCPRAGICKTLPVWKKLYATMDGFFSSVRLSDMLGSSD